MHSVIAVPVYKQAHRIGVAKGKHWSVIEHIVLNLLRENSFSVSELMKETALPEALLVEILTQLMRAGWVSLSSDQNAVKFVANEIGKALALSPELPAITKPETRWVSYVVELVSGKIFRTSKASNLIKESELEERINHKRFYKFEFPEENFNEIIAPQDFQDNLLEADEELISVERTAFRPSKRYMVLEVSNAQIRGVEYDLGQEFRDKINAAISSNSCSSGTTPTMTIPLSKPETRHVPQRKHNTHIRGSDIICGGSEHRETLNRAVQKSRHRLVIHSTFIAPKREKEITDLLAPAAARGVKIDILWGQDTLGGGTNPTLQAAQDLDRYLRKNSNFERVRISNVTSGSHSKFLIYDVGSAENFEAVIGSCNWLSSNFESFETSFRSNHKGFVADLCRVASSLTSQKNGEISETAIELNSLARRLDKKSDNRGNGTIELVFGSDHNRSLLDARDEARSNISILSHRYGNMKGPTLAALLAAAKKHSIKANIFFGRASGRVEGKELANDQFDYRSLGVNFSPVRKPRLHAKTLSWDTDNLIISSLNWLSADVPDECRFQEIGVRMKQKDIAKHFIERFMSAKEFAN